METTPLPTKRFVIDVGRKCSINCKMCYYRQLGDLRKQSWKTKEQLIQEIDNGINRGNTYLDHTGGEPTLHPNIVELIEYTSNKNIKTCIITNAIINSRRLQDIIDAGVDDFLVSVHGIEQTHDILVQLKGARKYQIKTLEYIKNKHYQHRFNFVINKYNQNEIFETAVWMASWRPYVINFINMNPHYAWATSAETKTIIADLRIVELQINDSIDYLESLNIRVNVRYYPMCRIFEKYRKCVANDLQVTFELYDKSLKKDINCEWDYHITPKTYEKHKQWGIETSMNIEEKEKPCCNCDLQWICGGINKIFHKISNKVYGEICIPQKIENINKNNFYYYRKNNAK